MKIATRGRAADRDNDYQDFGKYALKYLKAKDLNYIADMERIWV